MGRLVQFCKNKFRDMALFRKMIFFYIAILCIPTLLIGTFYIGSMSAKLQQQYRAGRQELLAQGCSAVEQNVAQIAFCRDSFQYNRRLLQYVSNYDFTTAEGAEIWMQYVKPAFEQVKTANPGFQNICIWRMKRQKSNDPRYVRNLEDNREISAETVMGYNEKKLVLAQDEAGVVCRIYQPLFDMQGFRQAGFVEIDCSAELLFAPLDFAQENEELLLTHANSVWRIRKDGAGKTVLEPFTQKAAHYKNCTSAEVESLGVRLDFYFPDMVAFSNSTMASVVIGAVILFVFFSLVYYAFYISVTRRITRLTEHMLQVRGEKMEPYRQDVSRDEIGSMIYSYNKTVSRVNRLNEEIIQKMRLADHARYYAMQSQIHPHFLYNTLENIDMLIELGENEKASKMMNLFGKILRYNLSYQKKTTTIEKEIAHAEDYLKLYSFRMRDDFSYEVDMDPACAGVLCPYCMLQPVVENCFKHGFRAEERVLWVRVRAYREKEFVWIDVEDNGSGISGERLQEVKDTLQRKSEADAPAGQEDATVGLKNVNERIRLLCGKDSGLFLYPRTQGCLVRILIRTGQEEMEDENTDCG